MSGYIPHDDDVAMAYIHGASLDYPVANRADALRAEFDRWLFDHDMQVRAHALAEGWDQGARWGLESNVYDYDSVNPYREETK